MQKQIQSKPHKADYIKQTVGTQKYLFCDKYKIIRIGSDKFEKRTYENRNNSKRYLYTSYENWKN